MQDVFIYLVKTCAYSGILLLYYIVALRNKRFHYYNRFYLLMSVALSLVLPFVNIEVWQWHSDNKQVIQLMNVILVNDGEVVIKQSSPQFSIVFIALSVTIFIAVCLLGTLTASIVRILRFRRQYPSHKIENITVINTDLEGAPFSFFKNLFWKNTLDFTSTTGKQILKHEMTHIQQNHSLDKVFIRTITSLFWLNPFYWLIGKELAMIHEFIADEKAIEDKNAEAFALMLLQSQYSKKIFSPAQSFNYSPIKRRLFMLTTSKKPSFSYVRRILILPLLAITILLFAFKLKNDNKNATMNHVNAPFTLVVDAGHGGKENGAIGKDEMDEKDINLTIAKTIEKLAPEYGITVKMTRTEDATVALPDRINFVKNQQPDAFVSLHTQATEEKQTDKSGMEIYIARDERNINFLKSKLLGSSVIKSLQSNFTINASLLQRKEKGIYVIDQNPYPSILIECGYINNPNDFKQMMDAGKTEQLARDVLQGVAAYANADKNDTNVMIDNSTGWMKNLSVDTTNKPVPLYLLDGKEISADEMKKIDPNKIESINVLKDSVAVKEWGEKGKNGVVEVKMKKLLSGSQTSSLQTQAIDNEFTVEANKVTIKANKSDSSLIVVNGEVMPNRNELDIVLQPDNIVSMNVLKGEPALKKYGEKGRNGVVEFATKNKAKGKQLTVSFSPPVITADTVIAGIRYLDVDLDPKSDTSKHYDKVFQTTQTPPSFPGGAEAWRGYLQRNSKSDLLVEKNAPPGKYTVVVGFEVAQDGNVSNAKALNNPGYGTAAEAVRLIQRGPKWVPAKQNGHTVAAIAKQSITFMMEEAERKKESALVMDNIKTTSTEPD